MQEEQLVLINDFYNPSYLESDYIISESNSHAYSTLINSNWPSYCMFLHGSSGSGKTHLAHIWKNRLNAELLAPIEGSKLMFSSYVIEDIDKNATTIQDEIQILHSYNNAIESKNFLLLTSTLSPYELKFNLPDLYSRMQVAGYVKLNDPDDELLRVIIIKEFHIRSLRLDTKIINFILINLKRNVSYIIKFIDFLDKESIKNKRSITLQSTSAAAKIFASLE